MKSFLNVCFALVAILVVLSVTWHSKVLGLMACLLSVLTISGYLSLEEARSKGLVKDEKASPTDTKLLRHISIACLPWCWVLFHILVVKFLFWGTVPTLPVVFGPVYLIVGAVIYEFNRGGLWFNVYDLLWWFGLYQYQPEEF